MAHAQEPDFVFASSGRVHVTWRGWEFSRLLVAEVWESAGSVWMVPEKPCSAIVRGLLHFPLSPLLPAPFVAACLLLLIRLYREDLKTLHYHNTCNISPWTRYRYGLCLGEEEEDWLDKSEHSDSNMHIMPGAMQNNTARKQVE